MTVPEQYRRVLDELAAALDESSYGKAEFGKLMGWKGDAMPRLVLKDGGKGLDLRRAVEWAERCGRRIQVVKPGDPVSQVIAAIRSDTDLPARSRRALEAMYVAAHRQLAEEPHRRQRPRASGER